MSKDRAWGYVYTPSDGRKLAFVPKEDSPACLICGRPAEHRHHVFFGTANRKKSEEYGMVSWLCRECHQGRCGAHNNRGVDLTLKQNFQELFEETNTREEFIKIFGKSYL